MGKFINISEFGIIYKVRFDKLSLNAASCQTADSILFVRISKELELKGLKITSFCKALKCAERVQQTKTRQKEFKFSHLFSFVPFL